MHGTRAEVSGRDLGEVIHRDAAGLVFKTKHDAATAPGEQVSWWEWVQRHVDYRLEALEEAIGQALGMKAGELRRALTAEIDLLKRQVAQLRAEFDADRNLRALQAEIQAARADVPKFPDLAAKQTEMRKEVANLKRELEATRNRLTLVHIELGTTRYQLEKKFAKPTVTVTLNTPEFSFVVKDDDPSASAAWQRFMENVVESNPTAKFEGQTDGKA